MTKPLVFNYKDHEELRQAYKELLADNQTLMANNRKLYLILYDLRQEVTELKQLNDGYVKIIAKNQETNNKLMALSEVRCNDCKWNDDVIEVVRCKDCRYRFYDEPNDCYMCDKHEYGEAFEDNDFCSWGETK